MLRAFVALEAEDPEGAWNYFYPPIVEAVGGLAPFADQVCRELRRKKLLKGEGSGKMATYYPTDKGREKVAA